MDTAIKIDYSSSVTLRRSDLQGGGNRVRECSTKAIRHKEAHPSAINREVIRRTISYVRRALDLNPNVLLHDTLLVGEAQANANKTTPRAQIRHTTSRQSARSTADV